MKLRIDSLTSLCKSHKFLGYYYHNSVQLPRNFYAGQKCVYIVLDSYVQYQTNLWLWTYPYEVKYIGMGNYNFHTKRPFNHHDDLFEDNLLLNPNRYLLTFPSTALTQKSAFDLESILIDEALHLGYSLSPIGLRHSETPCFQLWNKVKGHTIK